jgi:hypothetical protein
MAISALVNRHLFTTRVFDSGALSVLASVIHQFSEPGLYSSRRRGPRDDAVRGVGRVRHDPAQSRLGGYRIAVGGS